MKRTRVTVKKCFPFLSFLVGCLLFYPYTDSFGQTVSFSSATNFPAGTNPRSVAVGDLNGDGKPDLVVANSGNATISVLLGTGTGSFGAATNYNVGAFPYSVVIRDLNGDGKPDLAVANADSSNVSILLGNGDGTFGLATTYPVGTGVTSPRSMAIWDLNGDGKPDLAAPDYFNNVVSILLGNGDGSFGAATSFAVGFGPFSVAVGDLNGDGKPDLAVANSDGTVSILLGTSTPSLFGPATNITVGGFLVSVAIGDFNGDGKLDLAVASNVVGNSKVFILLGNGDGTFGPATGYSVDGASFLAIGDLNMDGKLDVAVTDLYGANIVSILLGTGTGSFGPVMTFPVGNALSVGIADLNGDGKLDLAVANGSSNTVSILLNTTPILSAKLAGTGSGMVTSSPVGIACGTSCSAAFGNGAIVTVTAASSSGSGFSGWSGDCTGTSTSTSVTMTANKSCTATFVTDATPPTAPSKLAATPGSSSQINLSWSGSTDNVGVTGYWVERCTGSSCSNFAQIATSTITTYSDTNLTAQTSYSYRVRASDAAGNLSAYSNIASATTTPASGVDLAITAVSFTPSSVARGGSITITYTLANLGNVSPGRTRTGFYLSVDNIIDTADISCGIVLNSGGPGAHQSFTGTATCTVPTTLAVGTYYVGAIADTGNTSGDVNRSNNSLAASGSLQVQ
jgi:hypothetical protein